MANPQTLTYHLGKPQPIIVPAFTPPHVKIQVRVGPWTTTLAPVQLKATGVTLTPNTGSQPMLASHMYDTWYSGPTSCLNTEYGFSANARIAVG